MGVPYTPDIIEMLKQITDDGFITNIGFLQTIYSYFRAYEFVLTNHVFVFQETNNLCAYL